MSLTIRIAVTIFLILYPVIIYCIEYNSFNYNRYFLPQTGIGLHFCAINSNAGLTAKQTKIADFSLISYNKYALSMFVQEDIYTSHRYNFEFYPYRISYYMDYAYLSYSLTHSRIGIVFDHICYNTIDKEISSISDELRWYGIGIKWQSNGMRTGYRSKLSNINLDIFSVHNIHYSFYVGYPFLSKVPEYSFISRFQLRYDIPLFPLFIPYIETYIQALGYPNGSFNFDHTYEIGAHIPISYVSIIPYSYFGTIHDRILPGLKHSQWGIGLKLESLLEHQWLESIDTYLHDSNRQTIHMHVMAGYAKNVNSGFYNFTTDFGISLQTFTYNDNHLFFSSFLNHSSRSESTALYPRFINILFTMGYVHEVFTSHYISCSYQHFRRHDGNEYRGQSEYYHSYEIILQNYILHKPINLFNTYVHDSSSKKIEYSFGIEHITGKHNYPYFFIIKPYLLYYLTTTLSYNPYVAVEYIWYIGKANNYEYSFEYGIVFTATTPIVAYYAFKRDIDIDIIDGAMDHYHIIGIKIKI